MSNDLVLRDNPQYRHIFEEQVAAPRPEVHWLAPITADGITLRNSRCGVYQVRRSGEPPVYSLWSVRVPPFIRLIRSDFKSFDELKAWMGRA